MFTKVVARELSFSLTLKPSLKHLEFPKYRKNCNIRPRELIFQPPNFSKHELDSTNWDEAERPGMGFHPQCDADSIACSFGAGNSIGTTNVGHLHRLRKRV
jgi:hypothetical protein